MPLQRAGPLLFSAERGDMVVLYLAAICMGLSFWLLILLLSPYQAIKRRTIEACLCLTLFLLFIAGMWEVQMGLVASLNDIQLQQYAVYRN